jgi:sigma-B regulation protein RsbU (phosphoserine phosphatase)
MSLRASVSARSSRGASPQLQLPVGRFQLILLAISLALVGAFWLFQGRMSTNDIAEYFIFTFIVGNCSRLAAQSTTRFYGAKTFPLDLLLLLLIEVPACIAGGYLALIVAKLLVVESRTDNLLSFSLPAMLKSIFFSGVITTPLYLSLKRQAGLELRNRELESQVTLGRIELQTQEAELRAASEIQSHLLPLDIPRINGLEIACAWQPARSVGGDYFDVLALAPGQIGLCLADVSGKGMTAALLMANLQALVRAFAPAALSAGALCRKVNEALNGNVLPGKFVTLFYGVVDIATLTLRFENAGHCQPIILRDHATILLTGGGTVLGLLPQAKYEERIFSLQSGDCLLLMTDGVSEATNEADEEFGAERVAETALAARDLGANGIRTKILEDVSRFCNGIFQDDASLIVMTVD